MTKAGASRARCDPLEPPKSGSAIDHRADRREFPARWCPHRRPGAGACDDADQYGAPGLPARSGDRARDRSSHDLPARHRTGRHHAVDLRRRPGGRHVRAGRWRETGRCHGLLGPGRVQRRRHQPCRRCLPAALAPVRRPGQPGQGVRATPGARLPADHHRTQQRQRRVVDTGRRNPESEPRTEELPQPSDSGPSYWTARTIWALGEGYASFADADPAFADFLQDRLQLAVGAVQRQVLTRYGQHRISRRPPGAGLVDRQRRRCHRRGHPGTRRRTSRAAPDDRQARRALRQLLEGVAEMGTDRSAWPYGAILPWAESRSLWHAWASQMGGALARGAVVLDQPRSAPPGDRRCRRLRSHFDHVQRTGQRLAAHPDRPDPDRVRRRLPGAEPAGGRRCVRAAGTARAGRHAGELVLRREPGRRGDIRPGHGCHLRRLAGGRHDQPQQRGGERHPRTADHARARCPPRRVVPRPVLDADARASRSDDRRSGDCRSDNGRGDHPETSVDRRVGVQRRRVPAA